MNTSPSVDAVTRKIAKRIFPVILIMFLFSYLDRVNIGFAKESMMLDTGLSEAAFAFGAGVFFIGYALFEVPSNIIMRRVGAKFWLARIMVTWGIISALMAFAHDEWVFYLLRFLLGVAEAGFLPGVVVYLLAWFPKKYRARANGYLFFGPPLAFIIGGPLSGALLEMNGVGGIPGWKYMFAVTGIITVAIGIASYFYLDNSPRDAAWLTDSEKNVIEGTLRSEAAPEEKGGLRVALSVLYNPLVLFFALIYFTIQVTMSGISFYLPTIVGELLGQKIGLTVSVVTAIPWVIAIGIIVLLTRTVDRTGRPRTASVISMSLAGIGLLVIGSAGSPIVGILAMCVAAGCAIATTPVFWLIPSAHFSGLMAATTVAYINSIGNLGGFVGPMYRTWAESSFGHGFGTIAIGMVALAGALLFGFSGLFRHRELAPQTPELEMAPARQSASGSLTIT